VKGFRVKVVICAAAAAFAFSATADAQQKKAKPQAFSAEAKVKSECLTCHTADARAYLGYLPVPQIAGAPSDYIENQLKAYAEGRRQPEIWKAKYPKVHVVPEGEMKAIAAYVASLPAAAHPDGASDLIEQGDKIFHNGAPENDIPVCAACHGDQAKGEGMFPRLAGQWRHYLIAKLLHFDRERGQGPNGEDNSQIMKPVAKALTKEQILAVTAYLSSLK
jgi:cytochrome c553